MGVLGWVASGATSIGFRDLTETAGVRFTHTDGSSGQHYIVETVASGLGLIDFDGDGYLDILFLNGAPLPGTPKPAKMPTSALYHNNRDGTFTDVTAGSGLDVPGYALGCAVADYDNDGLEDVLITYHEAVRLYHNTGNGRFEDATQKAGLAGASIANRVGAGCLFLDYDRDGLLDIFIGYYMDADLANHKVRLIGNIPTYDPPKMYSAVPNKLYHNNGNGTFSDVSDSSGIGKYKGYAMGLVSADFDGDGWPDIYVGNDVMENYLFHNKRNGTFEEIGIQSGCALDGYGDPQGTMGVNVGDYDGDGQLDIFVTDYQNQVNTLYRNLGNLQFQDVTTQTAAGVGSRPFVKWGCAIADFDNDGIAELFAASGHLLDTVEQHDKTTTYKERSFLLQQRGGRFVDVTGDSGGLATMIESSRGAVVGDLNNDGKLDIVVLNSRSRARVLMNSTSTSNHWSLLKLVGSRSNRSAVGAQARLTCGKQSWVQQVCAGRSYQSAEDLRLHFGLGTNAIIDRLQVAWPSGASDLWTNLSVDRVLRLEESAGGVAR